MTKRECGGCTACCSALGVVALRKPMFTNCVNCTASGCGIYADRPEECSRFECLWLTDPAGVLLRDEERPDKSGVIFYAANVDQQDFARRHNGAVALSAVEARSKALASWGGQKILN